MLSAVLADRFKQRPGEPAVPTAAHDEQVGAMCRVEQHAGRVSVYDALPDGNRAARWDGAGYDVAERLRSEVPVAGIGDQPRPRRS